MTKAVPDLALEEGLRLGPADDIDRSGSSAGLPPFAALRCRYRYSVEQQQAAEWLLTAAAPHGEATCR
jgi:hypothetical protein